MQYLTTFNTVFFSLALALAVSAVCGYGAYLVARRAGKADEFTLVVYHKRWIVHTVWLTALAAGFWHSPEGVTTFLLYALIVAIAINLVLSKIYAARYREQMEAEYRKNLTAVLGESKCEAAKAIMAEIRAEQQRTQAI